MTPSQLARSQAKRAATADRYISKCPWIARPPKIRLALIQITYAITDGEGDRLQCSTWTTGISSQSAMSRWLVLHPALSPVDASYTVATEPKHVRYPRNGNPGKRVEITDTCPSSSNTRRSGGKCRATSTTTG